jgi:hypothetical protein
VFYWLYCSFTDDANIVAEQSVFIFHIIKCVTTVKNQNYIHEEINVILQASPGVTYADLDCRLSKIFANFKIPLIDGAETVSTVLNDSKIRFRKLPVILITFGKKKYMLLRIYIVLRMSVTLKSPSRSILDIPQVVFDFQTYLYIHTPRMVILII